MILGFDIGGSRIKAGHDAGTGLVPMGDAPTPATDFDAFVATLSGFVADLPAAPRGIAISIAGVVDPDSGTITVANIQGAHHRPLARDLTARLGLPVLIVNDADCFALAEARQGAGRGHRNVFGIILGTGVGGGLVLDGRVVTGAGGYAGEWGHGPVVTGDLALRCGCGVTGCLDMVGAARGIERIHQIREGAAVTSHRLLDDWRAGDAAAGRTVQTWLALVGGQLAMLVNTLGVSVVPAGGGLSNAPDLLSALDGVVRAGILRATAGPLVVPATCGPDAGLIGAIWAGRAAFGAPHAA